MGILTALVIGTLLLPWLAHRALLRALKAPRRAHSVPWQAAETVRFPTANGRQLTARWWPAAAQAPVLLLMHGWGGNGGDLAPAAHAARAAGYGVLLPDARCHGDSDEDSFASLPRFAEDIDAALLWLRGRQAAAPVALLGHSLGAAACILAASRRHDIAAVVSVAAFAHPGELMQRWLATQGRVLRRLSPLVLAHVQRVIGHRFDEIAPLHRVEGLSCPLLLLHGRDDDTVPAEDAQRLAAACPQAECLLLDGDHASFADMPAAMQSVLDFLARQLPPGMGRGDLSCADNPPAPAAGRVSLTGHPE